jgi:hypothetical protein
LAIRENKLNLMSVQIKLFKEDKIKQEHFFIRLNF